MDVFVHYNNWIFYICSYTERILSRIKVEKNILTLYSYKIYDSEKRCSLLNDANIDKVGEHTVKYA